jgi:hypothetical protein
VSDDKLELSDVLFNKKVLQIETAIEGGKVKQRRWLVHLHTPSFQRMMGVIGFWMLSSWLWVKWQMGRA